MKVFSKQYSIPQPLHAILNTKPNTWNRYFNSSELASFFKRVSSYLKDTHFFEENYKSAKFFYFLKRFVKTLPQATEVLKAFNQVCKEIQYKFSLQTTLSGQQVTTTLLPYLNLLAVMLKPKYRYLFDREEITIEASYFSELSYIQVVSHTVEPSILYNFHTVLKRSFHSKKFLNDYFYLIQAILNLAEGVSNANLTSDALALPIMRLFDLLGRLDNSMKSKLVGSQNATQSIQQARNILYALFSPHIDPDFLKFIVYKIFLRQSYKTAKPVVLEALCRSQEYAAQCNFSYQRYPEKYFCSPSTIAAINITIEGRRLPEGEDSELLPEACHLMRETERFIPWMEALGIFPANAKAQLLLRVFIANTEMASDLFLFEGFNLEREVAAVYAQQEIKQTNVFGIIYGSFSDHFLRHEFIHFLDNFVLGNKALPHIYKEGMAELFAVGVCNRLRFDQLQHTLKDTAIFETLKKDKLPNKYWKSFQYAQGFKYIAYLVNEQPSFLKKVLTLFRDNNQAVYYTELDRFLNNSSTKASYLSWAKLQVAVCENYFKQYPQSEQPIIYLNSIANLLQNTSSLLNSTAIEFNSKATRSLVKRDLLYVDSLNDIVISLPKAVSVIETMLALPLVAFSSGMASAYLDRKKKNDQKYLNYCIDYGFRPLSFALVNASFDYAATGQVLSISDVTANFFSYLAINYLGLLVGQVVSKGIAKLIPNRYFSFLIQTLTWMFLWNPGLFACEGFMQYMLLFVAVQFLQGLAFKLGEQGMQQWLDYITIAPSAANDNFAMSKVVIRHSSNANIKKNTCSFFQMPVNDVALVEAPSQGKKEENNQYAMKCVY
jgi:hypothetical protein